jgi:3-oxoacyl-[acyl-carrier-protein] synthase-3
MGCEIKYISYQLASKEVTNEDLVKEFPEFTPEKIYKNVGIKKRFVTTENVIGSDLAFSAAQKMFQESKLKKEEIEFILFCTGGSDYIAPMNASLLQDRLGLNENIGALDLPSGCSGFTNALGMAKAIIESGQANNVLMLFGETPGLVSHPKDFALRSLFSDAGATVFIEKTKKNYIGKVVFGVDGSGAKHLFVDQSCLRNPPNQKWLSDNENAGGMPRGQMKMNGLEVFSFSIKKVPILVDDILKKNNLHFDDIDLFVFHQASKIILKSLQRKLKIADEKMAYYIENKGNTVSISIPIALKEAEKEGRIKERSKVLIAGFGIGFSWSGTVLTY